MPKKVIYYPDARGRAPALEFLLALTQDEQQKAFAYVSYLEERGERLRRPIADYLGSKIYELRPKQVRILYSFVGRELAGVLHAFRKKVDVVPFKEKQLAETGLADFVRRYERGLILVEPGKQ